MAETDLTSKARYSPPWANTSIIGIAGCSGSGKSSVAMKIIKSLNIPWVAMLVMDSYYKPLTPEQTAAAYRTEYDFDHPDALDMDLLAQTLADLKQGKKVDVPVYDFSTHSRQAQTTTLYSPHVLIVEGILAWHDPRVAAMMDVKIFVEEDLDICLGRRVLRDTRDRGRTVENTVKNWFTYVKPSFRRFIEPQRLEADIIVRRGRDNTTAIDMVVKHIQQILRDKSAKHEQELRRLGKLVADEPVSPNVVLMEETSQIKGMNTLLQDPAINQVEFVHHFNRLAGVLIARAFGLMDYLPRTVTTPVGKTYNGLAFPRTISAVMILRGGACLETAFQKLVPDAMTGRVLIQTNYRTGEPELHYHKLPYDIKSHDAVLLLDSQMSSGGAGLMAVRVLLDHGVDEGKIFLVAVRAGKQGLNRLTAVYPKVKVVVGDVDEEGEDRWIEKRYFGC
ncbi:Uridine kinase [Ascosphaera acerosa]|nr:Uridine kinase [Ascosphaera acerosa]